MSSPSAPSAARRAEKSFTSQAALIGGVTFVSRILGAAREAVASHTFGGSSEIFAAFTYAFTIPNLFRKLLGEGALSAAFIPLYAKARKREQDAGGGSPSPGLTSADFALASVNLLTLILIGLTVVGELVLLALYFWLSRPDYLLAVKLTAIMLPYVLLVCGTAFLGAILQVHARFTAITATSIVLNAVLIAFIVAAAFVFDLNSEAGQTRAVYLLAVGTLVAGVLQVAILVPSLRAIGFRFRRALHIFTPEVKGMLWLTVPVALSAGVLQIGVLLDKSISFALAEGGGRTTFQFLGRVIDYPMAEGAAARLNWAQFMYQFPLGVFAIALATAIFPKLAGDAADLDKTAFRSVLRRGLVAALFIGLPASVGMMVVAGPAVRLLFQHGKFNDSDARWVILSTVLYSSAIWAFSLQQILNRAYYALHDMRTPLLWGVANLVINLIVELPLLWTPLGESAMAIGTLVSFSIQSLVMTASLSRRVGGIGLREEARPLGVMVGAALLMGAACLGVKGLPFYPTGDSRWVWAAQLAILMAVGVGVYGALCRAGGIDVLAMVRRRKR